MPATRYYEAIPLIRGREIPLTLLPKLGYGPCELCGSELLWYAPALQRCRDLWHDKTFKVICPDCAQSAISGAPVTLVSLPSADSTIERAYRQG